MIRGKKICPSMSNPVSMLNTGVRSSPFFLKFLKTKGVYEKSEPAGSTGHFEQLSELFFKEFLSKPINAVHTI